MPARPVGVYRHLLRAFKSSFRGDALMLSGAKAETRSKYLECKDVRDPAEIDRLCDEALDAAKFLRETIVQAKLNERGNYAMLVEEGHLDDRGNLTAQSPEDILENAPRK